MTQSDISLSFSLSEAEDLIAGRISERVSKRIKRDVAAIRKLRAFKESVADITKIAQSASKADWMSYDTEIDVKKGLVRIGRVCDGDWDVEIDWRTPDEMREYLATNELEDGWS